jgi:hypothetical protein
MHIHRIGDVRVLNDYTQIPGLGFLPVNAFVLHAGQPAVIGTGLSAADKDFRVRSFTRCSIPPACGRYVLLTRTRQTSKSSNRDPGTRRKSMSAVTTSVQSF